jgi:predicted amidohydrolase YtcJ
MASRLTTFIVVLIVAGTLIAGLIVGAQRDDENGPVDLIVTNGRVHTPEGLLEALAVRGNKILRVGTNREIKRLRRPQTLAIDAHGGAVVPGFNDAHAHLLSGAWSLRELNLSDAETLPEIEQAIRSYAARYPNREWIRGRGWTYEPFGGELPTRHWLDALVAERPVWLTAYDGHTGIANSRALELAGIDTSTRNPGKGVIVKDSRSGEPTGALKEDAMGLMRVALPTPTHAERMQAVREAMALAHRLGVTSVQNASGGEDDLDVYAGLRESGDLELRLYAGLSLAPGVTDTELDDLDRFRARFPDDPLLKTGAVKLMLDGVVETHTATLLAPYADGEPSGVPNYSQDELNRLVTKLDARGWQVMIHALGDGAVRMALNAFEHAARQNGAPERDRRHRIEHIETIDPADVPRFAQIGAIASLQPYHGNPTQVEMWSAHLGPERSSRAWLYESLRAASAHVSFGSDWPVVSLDPRYGLHVATTRTSPEARLASPWIPEQRMSVVDAIDSYTAEGAYASFDDQRKGVLEAGMLADFVVFSGDFFSPEREVLDTEVTVTVFDGRVVFSRDDEGSAIE